MTDKQIIIDGVDVSGCRFYKHNGECENTTVWSDYCKAHCNCVYKLEQQLKRKEQECESLNRWLPIISRLEMDLGSYEKAKAIDYKSYIEQIFAELDELKEQLEAYKMEAEEGKEINAELKADIINLHFTLGKRDGRIHTLYQALQEIKEIANYSFNLSTSELMAKLEQILQKIIEVEDV